MGEGESLLGVPTFLSGIVGSHVSYVAGTDSLLLPCCSFYFSQMIKQVLQALADDNFNDKYYFLHRERPPPFHLKPFVLMVKKKRNTIFKQQYTNCEFIISAGLENYVKKDKTEEFLERVKAKKQTQDDLEINEQPKRY